MLQRSSEDAKRSEHRGYRVLRRPKKSIDDLRRRYACWRGDTLKAVRERGAQTARAHPRSGGEEHDFFFGESPFRPARVDLYVTAETVYSLRKSLRKGKLLRINR